MLVRTLAEGAAGGRIVETEAYGIGDLRATPIEGDTTKPRAVPRARARLCLPGLWRLVHVERLSETTGIGAGVLIRAIEPTIGVAIMERNRGVERLRDLARGPGRLCQALRIDRRLDGIDLCRAGPLWLGSDGQAPDGIGQGKRIGITRAPDSRLRFYLRGNRFVSGPQALNR